MKTKITLLFVSILISSISLFSSARATTSETFFTAVKISNTLEYVEIHNASNIPIDMNGWVVRVALDDQQALLETECDILLQGWLRPGGYGVLGLGRSLVNDPNALVFSNLSCNIAGMTQPIISKIELIQGSTSHDSLSLSLAQNGKSWIRNYTASNSNNLRKTGVFSSDFIEAHTSTRRPPLFTGGWYNGPPSDSGNLRIIEILPNAKNCSPVDTDLACGDYIKLKNDGEQAIDLAQYRLRVGYKGQNSTSSNTFTWNENIVPGEHELILLPGELITVYLQNDMTTQTQITNSGGFAWLEDVHGLVIYDNSIVEYADASADSKKGQSWAFDPADQQWKWGIPSPDAENVFSVVEQEGGRGSGEGLKPCRPDQFRNPETNRCKLISSTTSTLKPCAANQYRNLETNRCRLLSAASSTLKPCNSDQFRNPETNRCKKISSSTSSLKPCKPGQERNSETNRCRKVIKNTAVAGAIDEVPQESNGGSKNMSWWLAILAGGGVVLYGIYEWRTEIMDATLRLRDTFGKGGSGGE